MSDNTTLDIETRLPKVYEFWISADANTQSMLLPPDIDCEPALIGSIATYKALFSYHEKQGNSEVSLFCNEMIHLLERELKRQYPPLTNKSSLEFEGGIVRLLGWPVIIFSGFYMLSRLYNYFF